MSLRLTQATDYAIRAMLHISSLPPDKVVLRADIARSQDIPGSFIAKVLQSLVRAGLLRSSRGSGGGFTLAQPAGDINLLQIVEAMEGPLGLVNCVPEPDDCERVDYCPASVVWMEVQQKIVGILEHATLESLVCQPRNHNSVGNGEHVDDKREPVGHT